MNWRIGSTIISSPLKNKEKSNEKFKLFKQFKQFNSLNLLNELNFIFSVFFLMCIPREPKPVKLFVALLSRHEELFPLVEKELTALFGAADSACGSLPWAVTDYYEKEMGIGLLRRIVSFAPLISPEALAGIKLETEGIEERYQWIEGENRGRRVNIDPGYVDAGKVVLASTKGASHRIYLRSGIYGEVTLLFQGGLFQPLVYPVPQNAPHVSARMNVPSFPEGQRPKATDVSPWYGVYTYPDYLWPETRSFFVALRSLYLRQLKLSGQPADR